MPKPLMIIVVACVVVSAAIAQEAPTPNRNKGTIEEVIVAAQEREQSAQDVGISMTVQTICIPMLRHSPISDLIVGRTARASEEAKLLLGFSNASCMSCTRRAVVWPWNSNWII